MARTPKSKALAAVHETMADLRRHGAISDDRMRQFDDRCLEADRHADGQPVGVASGAMVFAVFQDARGHWRWRLSAPTGRTLAIAAEGYPSRKACVDAVEQVKHLDRTVIVG